jgi:hypothetical protein
MNTYLTASTAKLTFVNAMPKDGTKHQNMQRDLAYSLCYVSLEFFIDIILPAALWSWG